MLICSGVIAMTRMIMAWVRSATTFSKVAMGSSKLDLQLRGSQENGKK